MKTFEEILNDKAKDLGYYSWDALLWEFQKKDQFAFGELTTSIINSAEHYAKEYAREACGRQIESCSEEAKVNMKQTGEAPIVSKSITTEDWKHFQVDKDSILNTPNAADENYKADNWVSIEESLPETKKYVLCQAEKGLVFTAFYTKGHEVPYEDFDDEGEYDEIEEQKGTLFLKKGWYEECEQKHDEPCYFQRNPTHWQPLPQAPTN